MCKAAANDAIVSRSSAVLGCALSCGPHVRRDTSISCGGTNAGAAEPLSPFCKP